MGVITGGRPIEGAVGAIFAESLYFAESTGAGTYTGALPLPAGALVLDVQVHGEALWAATTSASLEVGDGTDPDGWWTAVNLKATDLLAGEGLSFANLGASEAGAYLVNSQVNSAYSAAARTLTATVVTVGAAGATGKTRVVVLYTVLADRAATKA